MCSYAEHVFGLSFNMFVHLLNHVCKFTVQCIKNLAGESIDKFVPFKIFCHILLMLICTYSVMQFIDGGTIDGFEATLAIRQDFPFQ